MKNIETSISIQATPGEVWQQLMDFGSFREWNPFITSLEGKAQKGEYLEARLSLKGKKPMIFKPLVLESKTNSEFRWRGKLWVKGIFDGEHYFILQADPNGGTEFIQGENFSGVLSGMLLGMVRENTLEGFKAMNEAIKRRCENQR